MQSVLILASLVANCAHATTQNFCGLNESLAESLTPSAAPKTAVSEVKRYGRT